jgi:hypothetical protein
LRFGSQRLLVLLLAWDTLLPVTGPFPQISHTLAIVNSPYMPFLPRLSYNPGAEQENVCDKINPELSLLHSFNNESKVFMEWTMNKML